MVFFFFFFLFWFLVFGFGLLLSRYSRGAWCFVGWVGVIYNMGKVLPSTGLQVHVTFSY